MFTFMKNSLKRRFKRREDGLKSVSEKLTQYFVVSHI